MDTELFKLIPEDDEDVCLFGLFGWFVCLFVQITMILHCIPYFHCLVPLLLVNFPTFVADHLISVGDFPPPEDGQVRGRALQKSRR